MEPARVTIALDHHSAGWPHRAFHQNAFW